MKNERGSATVVVLVLLMVLTVCAIGNSLVLAQLQRELKRVEHHQLEKYLPAKN